MHALGVYRQLQDGERQKRQSLIVGSSNAALSQHLTHNTTVISLTIYIIKVVCAVLRVAASKIPMRQSGPALASRPP